MDDTNSGKLSSMARLAAMEKVFARSQEAHAESIAAIAKTMSSDKAWKVIEKNNLTTPALIEVGVASGLLGKHRKNNLRKQPEGYAGLDGARNLLNDMIYESMFKYDEEIMRCMEYYYSQCQGMEHCRGQIAASNFIASQSRTLILDAQARINRCEVDIPTRKQELKEHNDKCDNDLKEMNDRLTIILGDIEVMTLILEM